VVLVEEGKMARPVQHAARERALPALV